MLTMRNLVVVVVWLLSPVAAATADGGVVLPPGRVLDSSGFQGSLITDSGHAVVGLVSPDVRGRMSVMVWKGAEPRAQTLELGGKWLELLPDDRVLIYGYKLVEGVDPYEDSYEHGDAYFVHQVYRIKGRRLHLEREFETSAEEIERSFAKVTSDFETWVRMANLYTRDRKTGRIRGVRGRHFTTGRTSSGKERRSEELELYPATLRDDDITAFEIVDPEGPTLLASYATDLFVVRFHDDGVQAVPIDHLRHVVHPLGSDLDVVWQSEDRVLWAREGDEWLAYDLWNVRYELAIPEAPFLRRSARGSPHPIRGFVEVEKDGSRHRVKHVWQSPQFANWHEEHVSEWRNGPPPVAVSPNGRHALVLESRSTEEGGSVKVARRFGLDLAPVLPPVEGAPVDTEGQLDVRKKPGH